jgi:hypothetical protein
MNVCHSNGPHNTALKHATQLHSQLEVAAPQHSMQNALLAGYEACLPACLVLIGKWCTALYISMASSARHAAPAIQAKLTGDQPNSHLTRHLR